MKQRIYTLNINYLEDNKKKTNFIRIQYSIQNSCWICLSHKLNKGYPRIRYNGKQFQMHRFIYIYFNRKIPKNKVLRHSCDNPLCINPKHLILGTVLDNIKDRQLRNRQAKGESISNSKLKEKDINYIRNSKKNSVQLSKELNLAHSTIYRIRKRKTWRHIK